MAGATEKSGRLLLCGLAAPGHMAEVASLTATRHGDTQIEWLVTPILPETPLLPETPVLSETHSRWRCSLPLLNSVVIIPCSRGGAWLRINALRAA